MAQGISWSRSLFVCLVISVALFSFVVPALGGLVNLQDTPYLSFVLFSFGFVNILFLEKSFLTCSTLLEIFAKGSWKHEINWNGNKFQDGRNAMFFAPFPFHFLPFQFTVMPCHHSLGSSICGNSSCSPALSTTLRLHTIVTPGQNTAFGVFTQMCREPVRSSVGAHITTDVPIVYIFKCSAI